MPKVFISYRQINDAELIRVRDLGERIRDCGVEVELDQFYKDANPGGPAEGWPKWCRDQAADVEKVLIIGSESWFRCSAGREKPGTGLGAAWEAGIVRQRLYEKGGINAFARVACFDKADRDRISIELKGYHSFHAEEDFNDLIAWLGGTPPVKSGGGFKKGIDTHGTPPPAASSPTPVDGDGAASLCKRVKAMSWSQFVTLVRVLGMDEGEFIERSTPAERLAAFELQMVVHNVGWPEVATAMPGRR